MEKKKPFESVEKIYKSNVVKLGEMLKKANTKLLLEQVKLESLVRYGEEYDKKIAETSEQGLHASTYFQLCQFNQQLQNVIKQQGTVVEEAAKIHESTKAHWIEAYRKLKSIEELIKIEKHKLLLEQEEKERKLMDELINSLEKINRRNTDSAG